MAMTEPLNGVNRSFRMFRTVRMTHSEIIYARWNTFANLCTSGRKKARFYTTVGEEWYYVDLHSDLEKRECCSLPKRIQKGAKRMREHTRLPSDPCTSSSSHRLAIFFNTFACDAKSRLSLNHGRLWVHVQRGIRMGHRLVNIQRFFVFWHPFLRVTREIFERVVV